MNQRTRDAYDAIITSRVGCDIIARSGNNLRELRETTAVLTNDEDQFYRRFWSLPLILEHRSTSWDAIVKTDRMLSLFELAKVMAIKNGKPTHIRHIPVDKVRLTELRFSEIKEMIGDIKINTSDRDFANFGNIDFTFFKLNVVGIHVNTTQGFAGVAGGSPRFFEAGELFDRGWISLDDWVSYSAGGSFTNDLKPAWSGFAPQGLSVQYAKHPHSKSYDYKAYDKIVAGFNQRSQAVSAQPRLVRTLEQEVFFGPDIRPGLALTLILHLRHANPGGEFIAAALKADFNGKVARLMGSIWRLIEAKIPGSLDYQAYHKAAEVATGAVKPHMAYFQ